jgi:hypothetical protein
MRTAPDIRHVVRRVLTIKPLSNQRNSLGIICGYWTGGCRRYPSVPTLSDIWKIPFRVAATFPNGISNRGARSGRGRQDREPLPVVGTDLHIRVVAAWLIAIVPDGPWTGLASDAACSGWPARGPGWDRARERRARRIRSVRPGRVGEANNDAPVSATATIAAAVASAAAPMASPMPVGLTSVVGRQSGRRCPNEIFSRCPLQKQSRHGC